MSHDFAKRGEIAEKDMLELKPVLLDDPEEEETQQEKD